MSLKEELADVCADLCAMLLEKNAKYGDSALNPCRVFSKASTDEQLRVRMDDKLSRLRNTPADEDNEDAIVDLAGYLLLYLVHRHRLVDAKMKAAREESERQRQKKLDSPLEQLDTLDLFELLDYWHVHKDDIRAGERRTAVICECMKRSILPMKTDNDTKFYEFPDNEIQQEYIAGLLAAGEKTGFKDWTEDLLLYVYKQACRFEMDLSPLFWRTYKESCTMTQEQGCARSSENPSGILFKGRPISQVPDNELSDMLQSFIDGRNKYDPDALNQIGYLVDELRRRGVNVKLAERRIDNSDVNPTT